MRRAVKDEWNRLRGKGGQGLIGSPKLQKGESEKSKEKSSIITDTLALSNYLDTCDIGKEDSGRGDLWKAAYDRLEDDDKRVLFKVEATLQLPRPEDAARATQKHWIWWTKLSKRQRSNMMTTKSAI